MLECGQVGILRNGRGGGGEGRGEDGPEGGVEAGDHFVLVCCVVCWSSEGVRLAVQDVPFRQKMEIHA